MTKVAAFAIAYRNLFLTLILSALITGCGARAGVGQDEAPPPPSAPSATVSTGTFVDSPVAGINYSTETQSGQTDANGHFSYFPGEHVTFSVGAIKLPPVLATTTVTPLDIAQTTDLNNQVAVNIAVFLQTLNQNANSTNGITISAAAHAAATKQIDFSVSSAAFSSNADLLDLVKNARSANTTLVSEATAKANLQKTLSGATGTAKIDIAPVANAGVGQSVAVGATVTLSGAGSNDANGDPVTYSWSFASKPAGSSAVLTNATAVNPTFVPDVAGNYVVSLTVNDGSLSSAANSVTVSASVANTVPVANAGPAQNVTVGATVTLDGASSSDANGDPLTYAWTFVAKPAGSTATLSNATSVSPTFVADVAGNYVIGLTVDDGKGNSPLVTATITSASSGSPPQTVSGTSNSPYLESELVTAGNLNPNGFVKSNSGRVFDLRWGSLDAPLSLSSNDNVTFTVQSSDNAGLFFRRLDGALFSYSVADSFVSTASSNQSTLAMQNKWITQPVLTAWASGLDGSKIPIAIIDDFTVNNTSEIQPLILPNGCTNVTAGGTTVRYCTTTSALLGVLTHGQEVALIISGMGTSTQLLWTSSGPYADPTAPTTPLGTLSTLQLVTASRSTPTYGIAYGANATTNRDDYLTYKTNTNGLFDQLQRWGTGTDAASVGYQRSQVINLSLGGTATNPTINTAIYSQQLVYANASAVPDAVFVKAAGNSACVISQTNCDVINAVFYNASNYKSKMLIVGALTADGGAIASYSNLAGAYADRFVVADGRGTLKTDGTYTLGTSFAAPRVAGYIAILRQKYPNLTAEDAAAIILATAKWNTAWGPKNAVNQALYGQGEADLAHALAAVGSLP